MMIAVVTNGMSTRMYRMYRMNNSTKDPDEKFPPHGLAVVVHPTLSCLEFKTSKRTMNPSTHQLVRPVLYILG